MVVVNCSKKDLEKLIKGKYEITELTGKGSDVKDLPRDEKGRFVPVFIANGVKYNILDSADGLGIIRYTRMQKELLPAQMGFRNALEMYNYVNAEGVRILGVSGEGKVKLEIADLINNLKRGVSKIDNDRYTDALYIATLFIVRDGEDTSRYSKTDAERKIADWCAENYNAADFLVLALTAWGKFSGVFSAEINRLEMETGQKLKANIGLATLQTGG